MAAVSRRLFLTGLGAAAAAGALGSPGIAFAAPPDEDGYQLWLRYRLVDDPRRLAEYRRTATQVVLAGGGEILESAAAELTSALPALLGRTVS
ncbi:MAG TPA: alpha-glucuronidase family glycosyl hydrolase, partial [Mycobacteriales bacterium]|nr:alpha-glucuronidase family glycosyl hydrolase [Mycobacteriales bacterium]